MRKRLLELLVACLLVLTLSALALTAMAADPYEPFAETVVITLGKSVPENDTTLAAGDTVENNDYTRATLEKFNISFKVLWSASGEAYDQKAKLSIASGEIPDVISTDYIGLKTAVQAGLVEDMTAAFDDYALDVIKDLYGTADNKALESATFDGKLMAIPSQQAAGDFQVLTWIRKDWVDNLGLEMPTTPQEVAELARAFRDNDPDGNGVNDTVGIVNYSGFEGAFAACNAFPSM